MLESDALTKLLCKKPPNMMTSSLANTATGMYNFLKFVKISKLITYLYLMTMLAPYATFQIFDRKNILTILGIMLMHSVKKIMGEKS